MKVTVITIVIDALVHTLIGTKDWKNWKLENEWRPSK